MSLDGRLQDTHPHALRQLDQEGVVAHLAHRPEEAPDRHDLVAAPDAGDQIVVLLLTLALRPDDEEIEDKDKDRQGEKHPHKIFSDGEVSIRI